MIDIAERAKPAPDLSSPRHQRGRLGGRPLSRQENPPARRRISASDPDRNGWLKMTDADPRSVATRSTRPSSDRGP
jgi:hypothetical protein